MKQIQYVLQLININLVEFQNEGQSLGYGFGLKFFSLLTT